MIEQVERFGAELHREAFQGDRERRLLEYMATWDRQGWKCSNRACFRSAAYWSDQKRKWMPVKSSKFYEWIHDLLPLTHKPARAMEELIASGKPPKYARRLTAKEIADREADGRA